MTPRPHLQQEHEFYVSPGTKNREAVIAAIPGVEVLAPSRDTINICAKREMAHHKQMYPTLEFHDRTILNKLRSTPSLARAAILETPSKFASAKYQSSASRFKAMVRQQRRRSKGIRVETVDDTLAVDKDDEEGGDDNPFQPVNKESKVTEPEDEQNDQSDSEESEEEQESEPQGKTVNVKKEVTDVTASQIDESDSSDNSGSDSGEGKGSGQDSDSDGPDGSDNSNTTNESEESDQEGQREEESIPDSVSESMLPSLKKSPRKRVSITQPSIRTYRNKRIRKVEEISDSDDDFGSHTQESQESVKPEPKRHENDKFYEAEEQFEKDEEQFETAPDHLGNKGETEDEPVDGSESESDREATPTKTRSSRSLSKTPAEAPKLSTRASQPPKSPTKQPSEARRRRRVLLDEDDGFDDGFETEFSRERQAEFFVQSDSDHYSDDEYGQDRKGNGHQNEHQNNSRDQVAVKEDEGEYAYDHGDDEENEHSTRGEFDDEFLPIQPRRRGKHSLQGGKKGRPRDKFNPSKDRLLLETSETAKKLAIPRKELFDQLTAMIGHTEFSLQTRLSKLEADENLRDIALNAPVIEGASVSDVFAKIMHKAQRTTGPKPRVRIPYTDLDDLAIKAFVCDLDPSKRGSYSSYEPFAEKYTHHDSSSVKGRWTKTLGPRTNEIELLEAKQKYTPQLEQQYLNWLHNTYPALFQG